MIRSMIILTVILSSNFFAFGVEFKIGLNVTSYYYHLNEWFEWIMWMIGNDDSCFKIHMELPAT